MTELLLVLGIIVTLVATVKLGVGMAMSIAMGVLVGAMAVHAVLCTSREDSLRPMLRFFVHGMIGATVAGALVHAWNIDVSVNVMAALSLGPTIISLPFVSREERRRAAARVSL